ncbi:hypothetical protein PP304_gp037 [Gordonia phage Phendrix]|uniref:Uncharacterized protein n=2 Tax=Godonkavirus TaxID=2733178 RepID=A0A4D6E210_9CAUD|nr:hypothetical protein HOV33_gp037 [Gordonia phage GodonK]YP_010649081.1 hypothetical protein PP304_gp037 [Gordonia phage Phendrix]QBZ72656.1 hypothetical protein SEA_GODONK_37 [Gordonia phage GodonK]QDK02585.1 hypothetical protein SEA_PHENDRIX_37 [Gordonia phage Phendrix]
MAGIDPCSRRTWTERCATTTTVYSATHTDDKRTGRQTDRLDRIDMT